MKISQTLSYALLVSATSAYKLHFFLGSQCNGQILDDLTNDEINDEPKCSVCLLEISRLHNSNKL